MSSLPADPERRAAAVVRHMLAHDVFSQWLGVEIVDVKPAWPSSSSGKPLNIAEYALTFFSKSGLSCVSYRAV